jgi:GTPase SAR1 family protein
MIKSPDYSFKITITGNPGVGKSSLLNRFCDGIFIDNYKSTIGVDFKFK